MNQILGIGSRISHSDYGDGVVINVKSTAYTITFMSQGTKQDRLPF
jgi:hypothetical protein